MISKLLGIDIPVDETEDGLCIISHDTLRRCVRENERLSVTCKPLMLNPQMCVFEATATDSITGFKEVEIGESNSKNLKSTIAKENPAIMAQYRAYDRALIQLLDLPNRKVYSNNEILNAKTKTNETSDENLNVDTKTTTDTTNTESSNEEKTCSYDVVYNCELRPEDDGVAIFDLSTNDYIRRKDGTHFLFHTKDDAITQLKIREEKRAKFKTAVLNDDEEILIGAYKGKKYGDVKTDNEFKEFIKGLKNSKIAFGDAERMEQLTKLKQLADAV